jgi:hypothetical protein
MDPNLMPGAGSAAATLATCGLVVVLSADAAERERALAALAADPRCEPGVPQEHWLPLAIEAEDPMVVQRWIETLPGVERCEVVFIGAADGLAPLPPKPILPSHE